jgi:hypothetical protein
MENRITKITGSKYLILLGPMRLISLDEKNGSDLF